MLAGSPGFTAVALISLSLAIAVVTCAYSEINGLIFRDVVGVSNPGELVALAAPASYPQPLDKSNCARPVSNSSTRSTGWRRPSAAFSGDFDPALRREAMKRDAKA
jgi:hypothetical protein